MKTPLVRTTLAGVVAAVGVLLTATAFTSSTDRDATGITARVATPGTAVVVPVAAPATEVAQAP